MTTYGLTDAGFVAKPFSVIIEEIIDEMRAEPAIGPDINLDEDGWLGAACNVLAKRESLVWELLEELYASQYTDAEGVSLDNVNGLVMVTRLPATYSTTTLTLYGVAGTLVAAGRTIKSTMDGEIFATDADATIGAGGSITVAATAQTLGDVRAPAGVLTKITSPVAGWTSVVNYEDAERGDNIEVDGFYRQRRSRCLQAMGSATLGAIYAKLLQDVPQVTEVIVYENDTDEADSEGRPPHSIEAVVLGGTDQAVADKVYAVKGGGIQSTGNASAVVTDSQGHTRTIYYSRPVDVNVYMHVQIEVGSDFDQGLAQSEQVSITTLLSATTYRVTINSVDFTYLSSGAATRAEIATALVSAINTGAWVPVTATLDSGGETFTLDGDYPGCPFVLTVDTNLEVTTLVECEGDQMLVINALVDHADSIQGIGDLLKLIDYYEPITGIANITNAIIKVGTSGPATGTSNLNPGSDGIADIDSTRTTIEII